MLNQLWPNGLGLFAGAGIILIGRAAGGILGIEALQFRLPWVKAPVDATLDAPPSRTPVSGPAIVGGSRAAG